MCTIIGTLSVNPVICLATRVLDNRNSEPTLAHRPVSDLCVSCMVYEKKETEISYGRSQTTRLSGWKVIMGGWEHTMMMSTKWLLLSRSARKLPWIREHEKILLTRNYCANVASLPSGERPIAAAEPIQPLQSDTPASRRTWLNDLCTVDDHCTHDAPKVLLQWRKLVICNFVIVSTCELLLGDAVYDAQRAYFRIVFVSKGLEKLAKRSTLGGRGDCTAMSRCVSHSVGPSDSTSRSSANDYNVSTTLRPSPAIMLAMHNLILFVFLC